VLAPKIPLSGCAKEVGFGKTVKQKANLEKTFSHKLAEVGVKEVNFSFIKQNLSEDQMRPTKILNHQNQIQPKFGRQKSLK